jgi:regulator of replication initiation timing
MPIRNISKDLQNRINDIDAEIEKTKQNLSILMNHRAGLQVALEHEQRQWGESKTISSFKIVNAKPEINTSGLKLSQVVLNCLNEDWKDLKTLKQDVKQNGIDLGCNQGRSIHTALFGLSIKKLAERNGKLWRKYQDNSNTN